MDRIVKKVLGILAFISKVHMLGCHVTQMIHQVAMDSHLQFWLPYSRKDMLAKESTEGIQEDVV